MRGRGRTLGPGRRRRRSRRRWGRSASQRVWSRAYAHHYSQTQAGRRRRRRRIWLAGLLAVLVAVVVLVAIWVFDRGADAPAETSPQVPVVLLPERGWEPLAALDSLTVIAGGSSLAETSYDRDYFGQRWADVDRNGCDTRNDMLRRDLEDLVVREGTQGCVAQSGVLVDPYSGEEFAFERGSAHAGELHIDHVVALADAWHKGAEGWTQERRTEFANDPMNLVVTLERVNQGKGARDAASWLPSAESAWCGFAVHVVRVKEEYDVAVASDEAVILRRLLWTCDLASPPLVGQE